MSLERDAVVAALKQVVDPERGEDIVELGWVRDLQVEADTVRCRVALPTTDGAMHRFVRDRAQRAVGALEGVASVEVTTEAAEEAAPAPRAAPRPRRLPGVKHVIAVGSGKGGVGKSTVAVNLAAALAELGSATGLLDADIYGPSIPTMLGLRGRSPEIDADARRILPLEAHGLKTISMGFMLKDDDAVVWRGPMLGKALQQLMDDVAWGELDYLIIDLPPGTGDVQLSMSQLVGVDGAVVVTTPQDVSHADVTRAVRMFRMLDIGVLGLVENMAWFEAPDTGQRYHVFGEGRTAAFAKDTALDLIAQIPLDLAVAPAGDRGVPVLSIDPSGTPAERYRALAREVTERVATQARERRAKEERTAGFFG